jgi:4-hydroxybenzoate polyprenyltransferase
MCLPCLLVPWHSIGSSEVMERKARFCEPLALFWMLRPDRTVMVSLTTGAAFAAKARVIDALWITLAEWCLAVGGFSLDFYADRDLYAEEPRAEVRRNPLMDGSLSPQVGLAFSMGFIPVSFAVKLLVASWALVSWCIILDIIAGLAGFSGQTDFILIN